MFLLLYYNNQLRLKLEMMNPIAFCKRHDVFVMSPLVNGFGVINYEYTICYLIRGINSKVSIFHRKYGGLRASMS